MRRILFAPVCWLGGHHWILWRNVPYMTPSFYEECSVCGKWHATESPECVAETGGV